MSIPAYPIINGHAYGFSSIEININAVRFRGFKDLKYSQKREIGKLYGNQVSKIARTRGKYDADGSLTMYQHEWEELRDLLGDGWMQLSFMLTVIYSEYGPLTARKDVLHGCTITSVKKGGSEGTEPLVVDLDFDIMYVEESGIRPMKDML